MVSAKTLAFIAIVSEAIVASSNCKHAPVVPLAGGEFFCKRTIVVDQRFTNDYKVTVNLLSPIPTAVLKKIAIGHGLQNYTCTSSTQAAAPHTKDTDRPK